MFCCLQFALVTEGVFTPEGSTGIAVSSCGPETIVLGSCANKDFSADSADSLKLLNPLFATRGRLEYRSDILAQAQSGNTVKVHYTGTFDDGTQFDSSRGRDPLELTLGNGQVIPGFEAAIIGMELGESKTVNVSPEQGYGYRSDDALQEFPRSAMPQHIDLQVGLQLQAQDPNGQPLLLTIAALSDDTVTLDANHPLAGKNLVFDLELVQID